MIKTYLVPITEEMIKAMEKGEAPSFLHCATCLDGLTNGEVFSIVFPQWKVEDLKNGMIKVEFDGYYEFFWKSWWDAKWGDKHGKSID